MCPISPKIIEWERSSRSQLQQTYTPTTTNPNPHMNDDVDDNSADIKYFSNENNKIQESSSTVTESKQQQISKSYTAVVAEETVFESSKL